MIIDTSKTEDVVEIKYKCNPFNNLDPNNIIIDKDSIELNVNCINVYFNINYKINRQRLYEYLIENNYICKYKPETYSGVKLIYKVPLNNKKNGKCTCSNKCTCINITFLIFQSGNVIAVGFKDNQQVKEIVDEFYAICKLVETRVKKRNQLF